MYRQRMQTGGSKDHDIAEPPLRPASSRYLIQEIQRAVGNRACGILLNSMPSTPCTTTVDPLLHHEDDQNHVTHEKSADIAPQLATCVPSKDHGKDCFGRSVQRVSAEVEFEQETQPPNEWFVSDARMERGEGTSGGAHSTAFLVFLDAATNTVIGRTFKDAIKRLLDLCEHVTELPNYKVAKTEGKDVSNVDKEIEQLKNDSDYSAPDRVHDIRKGSVLQKLMRQYCLLRNGVPGTYISNKSGIKEKGDKKRKGRCKQNDDSIERTGRK